MEKDNIFEGIIESYDANCYGVTKLNDKVVFVKNAIEGERVRYKIINNLKKYAFAEVVEVLDASKNRIKEECPYFGLCGGCDLWHMTYEEEKKAKTAKIKMSLKNVINPDVKFNDLISTNNVYGYRNKVMLPFSLDMSKIISGFYKKGSHEVVKIDTCLISSQTENDICDFVTNYLNDNKISIYDEENHKGLFRELMIRETSLNEVMVVLVLTKESDLSDLVYKLSSKFMNIKSIYYNINPNKTNVVLGDKYILTYGNKTVTENILGLNFEVSAASFMQVNHKACNMLYEEALRLANLTKDMNVIDAYCGMGSITLNIASRVNHVYGIEVVDDAIKNANNNKELNNISNATFICGKCEEEIIKLVNREKIDVIFVDPPRKGCDIKFLETVANMKISKIVYISCNVASLARDIKNLQGMGYELKEVTPVDLFNRTSHCESIGFLELKI